MQTPKQTQEEIDLLSSAIANVTEARDLAAMPGGERFIAFLEKSIAWESKALERLDPFSEKLAVDYARHIYCKAEFHKLVDYLKNAAALLPELEKKKLGLINRLAEMQKKAQEWADRAM